MALSGLIPVVEIMFGDFLFLAADQIVNHASKFRFMYNNQVRLPLIVRTPMGGKRGYGPTHSQSIEKHFLGLPGTLMLALNSRQVPGQIYDKLFATIDRPTMVIENKLLYGARVNEKVPAGFTLQQSDERFPCVRLRPEIPPDVTIVCYGGMLPDVEQAVNTLFDEHELACEVICPVQIYPLNIQPILEIGRAQPAPVDGRGGVVFRRVKRGNHRSNLRTKTRRVAPRNAARIPAAPYSVRRPVGTSDPARAGVHCQSSFKFDE